MTRVVAFLLLLVCVHGIFAQTMQAAKGPDRAVQGDIAALKTGQRVTLSLVTGETVQGSVIATSPDTVQLRVRRGFLRFRTETYLAAEVASIKKHMPSWVGPLVLLSLVAGIIAGVAGCIASGACSR